MSGIHIRDMQPDDEAFVGTCTHVNESSENDAAAIPRVKWLKEHYAEGVRVKVALLGREPVGFAHVIPVELCPWGPLGHDLAVMPCVFVEFAMQRRAAGKALVDACEVEALAQERTALAVPAYYWEPNFWFMPAPFFEHLGYQPIERRGHEALLWKPFVATAQPPRMLKSQIHFASVEGKVVVDLFWNAFCPTSSIEAQRAREVTKEFENVVTLREHQAEDRNTLMTFQCARAIYIDGIEISWGYEAPEEGIRAAIEKAVGAKAPDCLTSSVTP